MLPERIDSEIARIAADRVSGATALVLLAVDVLRKTAGDPRVLRETAAALCRAQPSMAGFHTAAALAMGSDDPVRELDALAARIRRSPQAIARFAVPLLRLRAWRADPLRIVTCSRSAAVEHTLLALAALEPLHVSCAESRPAREGIALARALAPIAARVEVYTDAGIGTAIPEADALVTGADALSPRGFVNKVGTAALATLARACGVQTVVLAGGEKVLPPDVFAALPLRDGPPDELNGGDAGWTVRNPYFERIAADVVSQVVTDGGPCLLEEARGFWSPQLEAGYKRL